MRPMTWFVCTKASYKTNNNIEKCSPNTRGTRNLHRAYELALHRTWLLRDPTTILLIGASAGAGEFVSVMLLSGSELLTSRYTFPGTENRTNKIFTYDLSSRFGRRLRPIRLLGLHPPPPFPSSPHPTAPCSVTRFRIDGRQVSLISKSRQI